MTKGECHESSDLSGLCSDSGGSSLSAGSVPGAAVFQGDRGRCCIPQAERAEKEKKIVFLSDLHNKEYGVGNERLMDAICKARPDLILIGGDMLVGKKGCSVAPALKFVSKLPAIAPVYYACGNHEQRMKRKPEVYGEVYQAYQKQLEECGVHFWK